MTAADDPFDLARLVQAQEDDYLTALSEIKAGRKESHWMWYIFPQIAGLGFSSMSHHYAIKSRAEAQAYLAHPILGPRLFECVAATLVHAGKSANAIFGSPDDLKLKSCATLFAAVSQPRSPFDQLLDAFFSGQRDETTLRILERLKS